MVAPKVLIAALALTLGLLVASGAEGASFNCARARTPVEKIICSDKTLGGLDDQLDAAYVAALHVSEDQDAIVRLQRQWLKARDACADRACVAELYGKQLDALKAQAPNGDPCERSEMDDIVACTEPQVRRADRKLARYVQAVRDGLKDDESDELYGALSAFNKGEVAFAAYREATCEAETVYFHGRTLQALFQGCWLEETRQHTQRVWQTWLNHGTPGSPPVLPDPSREVER